MLHFPILPSGHAEDLTINSISSKYDIKKAGIIRGDSRRDKFYMDNIETLNGNSYFTEYRVNTLRKSNKSDYQIWN